MGLPGAWGKIFTACTWTDVAASAALDITNSARELSVVETPRLPTYRARLFARGHVPSQASRTHPSLHQTLADSG